MKKSYPGLFIATLIFVALELVCEILGGSVVFAYHEQLVFEIVRIVLFIVAGLLYMLGAANFLGNWIGKMKIAEHHIQHILLGSIVISAFALLNASAMVVWCLVNSEEKTVTIARFLSALMISLCTAFFACGLNPDQTAKDEAESEKRREEILEAMKRRI